MDNPAVIDNKRSAWIDLVRVFAIWLVVLCHSIESGIYNFNLEDLGQISVISRVFAFSLFTFCRLASCLFLMMSGYLLLDRVYNREKIFSFWKRSWLHLLICTVIWFFIYDLFLIVFYNRKITVLTIIYDLLFFHKVDMLNVWYMPAVIGIYILVPFVAILLQRVSLDMMKFPFIFYCIISFGYPLVSTINTILHQQSLSLQLSLGFSGGVYCFYMICGYLIKKGAFKSVKTGWLILIIICSIAAGTGIQLLAYNCGVQYTIWRDNPFILFASVALFEAFSRIRITKFTVQIKKAASYSFAVYLVHVLVRAVVIDYIIPLELIRPIKVLILWAITLLLSYLISWLISKVPKAGNYLIYRK